MSNFAQLATVISYRRNQLGIDQTVLATRVGVSQQTISRWENGSNLPSQRMLARLADGLMLERNRLLRLAGYYAGPINVNGAEDSFDAAISDMPNFTEDQLVELVDRAWRLIRRHKLAEPGRVAQDASASGPA